jgi:hypothetical protein
MEHGRWWGVVATWLGLHGSPNTAGLAAPACLDIHQQAQTMVLQQSLVAAAMWHSMCSHFESWLCLSAQWQLSSLGPLCAHVVFANGLVGICRLLSAAAGLCQCGALYGLVMFCCDMCFVHSCVQGISCGCVPVTAGWVNSCWWGVGCRFEAACSLQLLLASTFIYMGCHALLAEQGYSWVCGVWLCRYAG